jgi:hypothetical protein
MDIASHEGHKEEDRQTMTLRMIGLVRHQPVRHHLEHTHGKFINLIQIQMNHVQLKSTEKVTIKMKTWEYLIIVLLGAQGIQLRQTLHLAHSRNLQPAIDLARQRPLGPILGKMVGLRKKIVSLTKSLEASGHVHAWRTTEGTTPVVETMTMKMIPMAAQKEIGNKMLIAASGVVIELYLAVMMLAIPPDRSLWGTLTTLLQAPW